MQGDGFTRKEYQAVPLQDPGDDVDSFAQMSRGGPSRDADMDPWRRWIGEVFVRGNTFQSIMAVVILANAAIIGLETDLQELNWLWNIFENVFLVIFVIELALRLFYSRLNFWSGTDRVSNIFDFSLVAAGVVDVFVAELLAGKPQGNLVGISDALKFCRLLRILRLFRLFKMVKPLYMLASGFLDSATAVFWVTVLCGLGLYICAIFLTRTLGRNFFGEHKAYSSKFGSVGLSMLSLFELMSNPDLETMEEIMLASPGMMLFFVIFTIYGSFAMLSILTGVISEGMIEKGNNHKEELRFEEERKKRLFVVQLQKHFAASDTDGDGTMTREEFHGKLPEMMALFEGHGFYYSEQDLQIVYDLVDFDQGGTVEVDEFLQGMTSFTANVSDLPLQLLRLQSHLMIHLNKMEETSHKRFAALEASQQQLHAKFDDMAEMLKAVRAPPMPPVQAPQKFGWC